MQNDELGTKQKIRQISKEEFLQHGFKKSGIRDIANKVGITKGAIYKHYASKELIFEDLVEDVVETIFAMHQEAFEQTMLLVEQHGDEFFQYLTNSDDTLYEYIFAHLVEFKLLLFCSDGTKYENFKQELITREVNSHRAIVNQLDRYGVTLKQYSNEQLYVIYSTCLNPLFEVIRMGGKDELNAYMDIIYEAGDFAWRLFLKDIAVQKIG